MNAAAIDGDDSRMSRPTAMRVAFRYDTNAASDGASDFLVDLLGIKAADVVGLEDVRIDLHAHVFITGCNQ